ncbi:hypothetical protein AB4305_27240 [Nocardia sp. 2YAB30]|uniref:hypothetical protein n=1 Tax=Nocardia sp. 2YAB30 TaxID=3233022 RepID=UPI003F9B0522
MANWPLYLVVFGARTGFGVLGYSPESPAHRLGDLGDVGRRLGAHLQHQQTLVDDQLGISAAHFVENLLRVAITRSCGSRGQGLLD